jgi:hypothetical protein
MPKSRNTLLVPVANAHEVDQCEVVRGAVAQQSGFDRFDGSRQPVPPPDLLTKTFRLTSQSRPASVAVTIFVDDPYVRGLMHR